MILAYNTYSINKTTLKQQSIDRSFISQTLIFYHENLEMKRYFFYILGMTSHFSTHTRVGYIHSDLKDVTKALVQSGTRKTRHGISLCVSSSRTDRDYKVLS